MQIDDKQKSADLEQSPLTATIDAATGEQVKHDQLIEVGTVASILCCSERTVWRWRNQNMMPSGITIGRAVRWSYRSLMEWIQAGCPQMTD